VLIKRILKLASFMVLKREFRILNRRLFIIGILFVLSLNIYSQEKIDLSFGFFGGYRLNSGCLFGNIDLNKKTFLTGEFGIDRYQNLEMGLGVFQRVLHFGKFSTFIGGTYTKANGGQNGFGPDNMATILNVSRAYYLTPWLCQKFNISDDDNSDYESLFIRVGYKISMSKQPSVSYISGPSMPDRVSKIETYISDGMVFSIGIIAYLHPLRKMF
jgi:hypothetical protein